MKSDLPYGVVLGLGGSNPLGVIRSLGYEGIPVVGFHTGEKRPNAAYSKYLHQATVTGTQEQLIEKLVDFGRQEGKGGIIFPTGDRYIEMCDRYRDVLSPHFNLPYSPAGPLETLIQKTKNVEIGEQAGFKTPFSCSLAEYTESRGIPVIVKPRNSVVAGKNKMHVYDSDERLLRERKQLLDENGDMIVQEFIPGNDQNITEIQGYESSQGSIFGVRRRVLVALEKTPFVYMNTIMLGDWNTRGLVPATTLLSHLKYNRPVDIDLKESTSGGELFYIEANLRTNASSGMDAAFEANLPAIVYFDQIGEDITRLTPNEDTTGTWVHEPKVVRYLTEGGDKTKLIDALGTVVGSAFYDPTDPQPFIKEGLEQTLDPEVLRRIKRKG